MHCACRCVIKSNVFVNLQQPIYYLHTLDCHLHIIVMVYHRLSAWLKWCDMWLAVNTMSVQRQTHQIHCARSKLHENRASVSMHAGGAFKKFRSSNQLWVHVLCGETERSPTHFRTKNAPQKQQCTMMLLSWYETFVYVQWQDKNKQSGHVIPFFVSQRAVFKFDVRVQCIKNDPNNFHFHDKMNLKKSSHAKTLISRNHVHK